MNNVWNTIELYKKWLILPVLGLMLWQQKTTFKVYEMAFSDPVNYIKNTFGTDMISQYSNRYTDIRKTLSTPFHASYIGETKAEEDNENPLIMHYYITQYNVAPVVLTNSGTIKDTILYNLYSSGRIDPNNYYLKNGWHIVNDYGNGVILLAK